MAVNGTYIQYGAGPSSCPEGWLSFDASPTLRLQRLPLIGRLTSRLAARSAKLSRIMATVVLRYRF